MSKKNIILKLNNCYQKKHNKDLRNINEAYEKYKILKGNFQDKSDSYQNININR